MTIDEARLDRRVGALIDMAKRRNGYTDTQIASFLQISAGTLANKRSAKKLHTLSVRDVAMIQKMAGDEISFGSL
jgi:hypothetical protein